MRRVLALSACIAGCWSSIEPPLDAGGVVDAGLDAPGPDAPDGGQDAWTVMPTCSEFALESVTGAPGRAGYAFPGSLLTLRGRDLAETDAAEIGTARVPFRIVGDRIEITVPPRTSIGPWTIFIHKNDCIANLPLQISRAIALGHEGESTVELLDISDFSLFGSVPATASTPVQGAFFLNAHSFVVRGASGEVVLGEFGGGAPTLVGTASGPFVLQQSLTAPSQAILLLPQSDGTTSLLFLDAETASVSPYSVPVADPVAISVGLEGPPTAALSDGHGQVWLTQNPLAAMPDWAPLSGWATASDPIEPALSICSRGGTFRFGVVRSLGASSATTGIDGVGNRTGTAADTTSGLGAIQWALCDLATMETDNASIIAADLDLSLQPTIWQVPLLAEPDGVVRTQSAYANAWLGVLGLHSDTDGGLLANQLHLLTFTVEPPVERRAVPIAGLRGVVGPGVLGAAGPGAPFFAWTTRTLHRIHADVEDEGDILHHEVPADRGDITFVALSP